MWDIFQQASEYGVLGILCLALALGLIRVYNHARLDRKEADLALKALRDQLSTTEQGRTEDAKRFTGVALKLQSEVISSVASIDRLCEENAKLTQVVEKLTQAVAGSGTRSTPPKV